MKKRKIRRRLYWLLAMITLVVLWVVFQYYGPRLLGQESVPDSSGSGEQVELLAEPAEQYDSPWEQGFVLAKLPAYEGKPYCQVNDNIPYFTIEGYTDTAFESYSELDNLGRCGVTIANVCRELMPTRERGPIGEVKPSGWQYAKYDFVDGKYLYNRCHLVGFQLTGENANERNLITGTRYLNVEGMLPFENRVAEYVRRTGGHVLYRVTPCFEGENLLATGVLMEAWSVEDEGAGICFNVFCYNVQPGVEIDYATGESRLIR